MPAAKPPEFRRRAVELARRREKPIAALAADLGIAESCLRRWIKQDGIDAGRAGGLSQPLGQGRPHARPGPVPPPPPARPPARPAVRAPIGDCRRRPLL